MPFKRNPYSGTLQWFRSRSVLQYYTTLIPSLWFLANICKLSAELFAVAGFRGLVRLFKRFHGSGFRVGTGFRVQGAMPYFPAAVCKSPASSEN